jgi:hypothetical protein
MNEYEKLRIQLEGSIDWINTLIEVADSDNEAEMSWFIPALTLDYHGYATDPFWVGIENMDNNESKNAYFQQYAQNIIDNLTFRIMAANLEVSYEDYIANERGRPVGR